MPPRTRRQKSIQFPVKEKGSGKFQLAREKPLEEKTARTLYAETYARYLKTEYPEMGKEEISEKVSEHLKDAEKHGHLAKKHFGEMKKALEKEIKALQKAQEN